MRFSRLFVLASSGGLWLVIGGTIPAHGRGPRFEITPSTVTAGRTLSVTIHGRGTFRDARVRWGKREARFYKIQRKRWRALVGVPSIQDPGLLPIQVFLRSTDETPKIILSASVTEGGYPVSHIRLSPARDKLYTSGAVERDAARIASFYQNPGDERRLWHDRFLWPSTGVVTTVFGARRRYGDRPATSPHSGTDIANAAGTPILAPAPGRVVLAEWLDSFGHTVLLDHGQGVYSYYLHMQARSVESGTQVRTGDPLGLMGKEGVATGPHLHWSLVVSGEKVDPLEWTEREIP